MKQPQDAIDDLLCEIDNLESEMRGLHFKRNVVDAYYLSLWLLVIAAWLHSGGLKRLRAPTLNPPKPTPNHPNHPTPNKPTPAALQHFHAMDILLLLYISSVLVPSPNLPDPRLFPKQTQPSTT